MFLYYFILLASGIAVVKGQYEGESCRKDNAAGTCLNIRNCQSAIDDIKNRKNPQICSFSGADPIVCCINKAAATTTSKPVATTTKRSSTPSTTEYVPPYYDYKTGDENSSTKSCEPISANLTTKKTGKKAWDKCIEYQEKLVYPCSKGVDLTGTESRANKCYHNADDLITGGVAASRAEFPHMVLLGFGTDPTNIQWLCGGTVISEKFILTAGHCTFSREAGAVTYILLGILKRTDKYPASSLHKISRIIKHPEYLPPSKYNDIALLETETTMKLDQNVVPACLNVGDGVKEDKASVTGWGLTRYRGSTVSDVLQKAILTEFTQPECFEKFPVQRLMKQGFDQKSQMCYGDRSGSKDTCQGDSGGPIQVKNKKVHCMYTIIGVTSFGKACGFAGEPGIYTRVSNYVPWIESIVWP